ncbi:choice-of-anchor M domain-containing protein [Corynebacterium sp. BF-R-2]|uniref:choice-of-anchor M domain-containing protein n=1 Tax=Corynebacterium sp. BF-R-2 TaxID=2943494 RepID=UPI00211F25E9|nr:choice-of-anchor M domain-containing protein [Corynebacterium sp. BF-R-2]MCQ9677124.1 choice-of-anchor M domain-containing protein [Corynebacterium sp. BF-R-2]
MNRLILRPLTLTAAAALALSIPTTGAPAPLALAADTASDTASCDADSQHAFTRGHQDLALLGNSGDMRFVARDDESGDDYSSGDFYVEVGSNAAFDDAAGGDIPSHGWQIPQTQNPDIPWLGFNTSYIDESAAQDATLSMTLHSGPDGGRVVGFQNSLGGAPTVLFDSEDPDVDWDYPDHFHSHTGIVFTEPGAYAVTFTFSLNDGSEHSIDVPFLVGGADTGELCQLEWGSGSGSASRSGSAKNRPQQLAKDINDTSKAIAQLDKTMDKTFKEADTFLNGGKPSESRAPRQSRDSTRTKESTRTGKPSAQPEPAADHPQPQRQDGQPQRQNDRQNSHRQNAASHNEHTPRDSTQREGAGRNEAQGSKDAARERQRSAERTTRSRNASAQDDSHGTDTLADAQNIEATSYGAPMVGFWAGFLAGMGALALLLGIGLFIAVQFFRPRTRD